MFALAALRLSAASDAPCTYDGEENCYWNGPYPSDFNDQNEYIGGQLCGPAAPSSCKAVPTNNGCITYECANTECNCSYFPIGGFALTDLTEPGSWNSECWCGGVIG